MGWKCCPHYATTYFKAWYSHSILCYVSQQTYLSVLTYNHTMLRLELGQLLVSAEYEFSSYSEFYSSTSNSGVKCCVTYCQIPRFPVQIPVSVLNQLCLTESQVVSGVASHGLEVQPTSCNWFESWFSHSLLFYVSQQTSLPVLTYKHNKLRLALGHQIGSAEYQFSSCTELLLQFW